MDKFGLQDYFDLIVNSAKYGFMKVNPDAYIVIAKYFGVEHSEMLLVDDSDHKLDVARSVGVHAIRFEGTEKLRVTLRSMGFI